MKRIRRFMRLSASQKWMLAEALVGSAGYRFAVLHVPFAKIAKNLGEPGAPTEGETPPDETVRDVAWAVDAVCRRTPWESRCLVRALTARRMLVRRGRACTLYMGVKKAEDGGMEAHAWTRCGNYLVTGGREAAQYTVTGVFGTPQSMGE